jgi:hypothetical protein
VEPTKKTGKAKGSPKVEDSKVWDFKCKDCKHEWRGTLKESTCLQCKAMKLKNNEIEGEEEEDGQRCEEMMMSKILNKEVRKVCGQRASQESVDRMIEKWEKKINVMSDSDTCFQSGRSGKPLRDEVVHPARDPPSLSWRSTFHEEDNRGTSLSGHSGQRLACGTVPVPASNSKWRKKGDRRRSPVVFSCAAAYGCAETSCVGCCYEPKVEEELKDAEGRGVEASSSPGSCLESGVPSESPLMSCVAKLQAGCECSDEIIECIVKIKDEAETDLQRNILQMVEEAVKKNS